MPIIESSIQRVRLTQKQHDRNEPLRSAYRTTIKRLEKAAAAGEGDLEKLYREASAAIDHAYSKGLIKKNKASRQKSRLSKYVK
ncbi:30S ribosomal protein S20 [Convivina intestini]|uniref:Small ribosomal subunit protein bS20 n=1 Tax=Convivina intestini TaxID=1505726 RepID=A0A2U1DC68_9LACO|nr:30S ribosomal protein S20 [Convivina intestini]PVY85284.1 SSU ribosomal protein S20P [Convivina intestini]CAH1850239.1 30S ribosomal protein S20 [Convivina intestini]CAH1852747.1 30S ribosomal protein S20 [Convivina intestini]SDB86743.1 SSU ribosomal protein S20P [Leuconostocaceae bacterium R-53105]